MSEETGEGENGGFVVGFESKVQIETNRWSHLLLSFSRKKEKMRERSNIIRKVKEEICFPIPREISLFFRYSTLSIEYRKKLISCLF